MVVYEHNDFKICTVNKEVDLLIASNGYFTTPDGNWKEPSVRGYWQKFDAQGNLLPQDKWEFKIPYETVIQVYPDGNQVTWHYNKKEGFKIND